MSTKHRSNASTTSNGMIDGVNNNNKVVILTFGDTIKSQVTTAKPILDQYGFKASFFITCGFPAESSKNKGTEQ